MSAEKGDFRFVVLLSENVFIIMLVVLKNGIAAVVTCKVSGSLSRHLTYVPLGKHDDMLDRDDIKDISFFNLLFRSFKNSLQKLGT